MSVIPKEAIDAGVAATLKRFPNDHEGLVRDDVITILEAALPHLPRIVVLQDEVSAAMEKMRQEGKLT